MKALLIIVVLACTSLQARSQDAKSTHERGNEQPHRDLPDTLMPSRVLIVGTGNLAVYGSSLAILNQYWYKNYPRSHFHFFNDDHEWMQMDKGGHVFTTYMAGKYATDVWQWTGVPFNSSVLIGGLSGLGYQTVVELLDAYSSGWGFSWGDMGANALGSGLFISQEFLWKEQRVLMKFSAHPIRYDHDPVLDAQTHELYGHAFLERILKDYNGQTYWMSANLHSFFPDSPIPKWVNLAVGFGAENMYAGRENQWFTKDGSRVDYRQVPRRRQYYLAPDIDLTRIYTRKKGIRILLQVLNMIKIPAPALEVTGHGNVHVHLLYF